VVIITRTIFTVHKVPTEDIHVQSIAIGQDNWLSALMLHITSVLAIV